MTATRMREGCCDQVARHLPSGQAVGRKGGRPPIPHHEDLPVICFVLAIGCRLSAGSSGGPWSAEGPAAGASPP